jgi:hypothetical protein
LTKGAIQSVRADVKRGQVRLALVLIAGAALAAVFPAAILHAQVVAANDAIPLQIGNSWSYEGTIWWVPRNSRRVLEERVSLEVQVVEMVEWGRMRGAVLTGYPRDLLTAQQNRFEGEFTLVQIGSRIHLLRGEVAREAIRRLREHDQTVVDLVAGSEVVLDLPLISGKTFCSEGARRDRRCWNVQEANAAEVQPVYGLRTVGPRQRYVLRLESEGEHEVWGFAPGVGFTSIAIGHVGDPSALELELVEVDLVPARGIFLKTLDLADARVAARATGSSALEPGGDTPGGALPGPPPVGTGESIAPVANAEPAPPEVAAAEPAPPPDADGDGVPDEVDRCADSPETGMVDREGCPLDPPQRVVVRERAPTTPAILVVTEELPVPEYEEPRAACLDEREWFLTGKSIEFDGRTFDPIGTPEPISLDNLIAVGEYDGVPLYVGRFADEPHMDLWLPVCESPQTYRLYADLGAGT